MRQIVVLTPTYNRENTLRRLYDSLMDQTDNDFTWLVVDDGSTDGTRELVEGWATQKAIDILYLYRPNGGKARALNFGFDALGDALMALVVDSDDWLLPDAVSTVRQYLEEHGDRPELGGFFFQYQLKDGNPLPAPRRLEKTTLTDRLTYNRAYGKNDGCNCYHHRAFTRFRYPEFDGEKYVGPTVIQLMMAMEGMSLLFSPEVIGVAEYLPGGLTHAGRRLRVKNPLGMAAYCKLGASGAKSWLEYAKNEIMGWAYLHLSGRTEQELAQTGFQKNAFDTWSRLPGAVLAAFWRRRYLS